MIRLLIATDAWRPQVNGVVRSIERLVDELPRLGAEVTILSPGWFRSIPLPTYMEIRLAIARASTFARHIEEIKPDAIHVATEGPVGFGVRHWCLRNRRRFTTSYHTRFPEYVAKRLPIPLSWTYSVLTRFHNAGNGCMVATPTLRDELARRGFRNLMYWTRGVDGKAVSPA